MGEDTKFLKRLKKILVSKRFWWFYSRVSGLLGLYLFTRSVFTKDIIDGVIGLFAVYVGYDVTVTKNV